MRKALQCQAFGITIVITFVFSKINSSFFTFQRLQSYNGFAARNRLRCASHVRMGLRSSLCTVSDAALMQRMADCLSLASMSDGNTSERQDDE